MDQRKPPHVPNRPCLAPGMRGWRARLSDRSSTRPSPESPHYRSPADRPRRCLAHGGFGWSNAGAFLIVLSNFVDHTDGGFARISGKSSKIGHFTTSRQMRSSRSRCSSAWASGSSPRRPDGRVAGAARRGGRRGRRADLLPAHGSNRSPARPAPSRHSPAASRPKTCCTCCRSVTLFDGVEPFLLAASIGAPLFAAWVVFDWWRIVRRGNVSQNPTEIQASNDS